MARFAKKPPPMKGDPLVAPPPAPERPGLRLVRPPPTMHPPKWEETVALVGRALRARNPGYSVSVSETMGGWCRIDVPNVGPVLYCSGSHDWTLLVEAIRGALELGREAGAVDRSLSEPKEMKRA